MRDVTLRACSPLPTSPTTSRARSSRRRTPDTTRRGPSSPPASTAGRRWSSASPTPRTSRASSRSLARAGCELAVRSGGHSPAGHSTSEGGIVLDLSAMRGARDRRRATHRLGRDGLDRGRVHRRRRRARPRHRVRRRGLGRDRRRSRWAAGSASSSASTASPSTTLLAADVVTADGELLRVDADNHADLFWALRGGGGNFGVATRLQYRLHEVDTIVGGMLLPAGDTRRDRRLHRRGRGRAGGALDDRQHHARAAAPVPGARAPRPARRHGDARLRGRRGGRRARRRAVPRARDPDRRHGPPDAVPGDVSAGATGASGPSPSAARSSSTSSSAGPRRRSSSASRRSTAPRAVAQLRVLGGAMARVPADATAFAHRERRIMAQRRRDLRATSRSGRSTRRGSPSSRAS